MRVSVIIPCYNRAQLTAEAVHSVLNQTSPADEILIIDDGSTDRTEQVLNQFRGKIRYIRQANSGVSSARNLGIKSSKYEWLAFLDSDDLWTQEKLFLQRMALADNPEYKICYTGEHWQRNGCAVKKSKQQRKYGGWVYEQCLPSCIIAASSVLVHRCVFDRTGLFDISLPACEDYDMWLRMALVYPFLYLEHACIIKRQGNWPSLSQQHSLDRYRIRALQNILKTCQTQQQSFLTQRILGQKCRIYARGCMKHRKKSQAEWAMSVARDYRD